MAFSPCIGNSFAWLYKAAAGKQIGSGGFFLDFFFAQTLFGKGTVGTGIVAKVNLTPKEDIFSHSYSSSFV